MRSSRRGQAELLGYIMRIMLIALLAFLLAVQIGFYTNTQVPTQDLEAELVMQRILFGPDSLALRETKTGMSLPGTVDLAKLNDGALQLIYQEGYGDDNFWGGRVRLFVSRDDLAGEKNPLADAYLNRASTATKLLELAKAGVSGTGSGAYYAATYPVLFRRQPGAQTEVGFLKIELVKRT